MGGIRSKCLAYKQLLRRARRGGGGKNGLLVGSTGQHPPRRGGRLLAAKRLWHFGLQAACGLAPATCGVELPNGWDPRLGTLKEGIEERDSLLVLRPSKARPHYSVVKQRRRRRRRGPRRLPLGGLVSRIQFGPAELAGIAGWALRAEGWMAGKKACPTIGRRECLAHGC